MNFYDLVLTVKDFSFFCKDIRLDSAFEWMSELFGV